MNETIIEQTDYATVSLVNKNETVDIVTIDHPKGKASVSLYGGHVLTWQPSGHKPVIWISESAEFQEGKAIRGGVPICWPWFGPLLDETGQNVGNHGFARNSVWRLDNVEIAEQQVTMQLSLSGDDSHRLWPEPFKIVQTLIFGQEFTQELAIENRAEHEVEFSSALHSYFQVSHPKETVVEPLAILQYDDKISLETQQKSAIENCIGPIDRIYYGSDNQEIIDQGWQRKIKVESRGCHQWVFWNPGKDIATNMADVHYQGENEFVCLEAANTQWQAIPAKTAVKIAQTISVSSI